MLRSAWTRLRADGIHTKRWPQAVKATRFPSATSRSIGQGAVDRVRAYGPERAPGRFSIPKPGWVIASRERLRSSRRTGRSRRPQCAIGHGGRRSEGRSRGGRPAPRRAPRGRRWNSSGDQESVPARSCVRTLTRPVRTSASWTPAVYLNARRRPSGDHASSYADSWPSTRTRIEVTSNTLNALSSTKASSRSSRDQAKVLRRPVVGRR